MKPVRQTKFSLFYSDGTRYSYGNCLVACIASWLDLPIDEVPNIYTFYGLDPRGKNPKDHLWVEITNTWLYNKFRMRLRFWSSLEDAPDGHLIARGKSFRDKPHTCIYEKKGSDLQPFFDPHPTDQFLAKLDYFITIETIS
jgi:hypothetical protein